MQALQQLCRRALQAGGQRVVEFGGRWYDRSAFAKLAQSYWAATDRMNQPTVAFVATNTPESLALFLAMLAAGHRVRMLYPFQSSEALCREIGSINPDIWVLDELLKDSRVEGRASELGCLLLSVAGMATQVQDYWSAPCNASSARELVLLTSGTTGPAKPFALSYDTILRHYTGNAREQLSLGDARQSDAPTLLYFPISNITGLFTTLPALVLGQPIILLERFSLDAWLQYVDTYQPVTSGLPPVAYKMILDAEIEPERLACLNYLGSGAAPLTTEVKRSFEDRFGIDILFSYGATEFGGPVTRMSPDLHSKASDQQKLSQGKPLPGMKIRVVDVDTGAELNAGQQGRVEVVSCRMGDDWIVTNDLGSIDADGFVFLYGRVDGAIMRGGFKILPATLEAILLQHPAVAEAAVVAIPDSRVGEVPGAAIVLKPEVDSIDASVLADFLRARLPAPHLPADWRFVTTLPKTPSLKVSLPDTKSLFT